MRTSLKFGTRKARFALIGLALAGLAGIPSAVAAGSTSNHSDAAGHDSPSAVKPTIVLEHGAWADGSSWDGVVTRLQNDGYTVDVPPTRCAELTAIRPTWPATSRPCPGRSCWSATPTAA